MDNDASISLPAQENVQDDLRELFRGAIRFTLESYLEEELVEMIGAERYERTSSRRGSRNGSYLRNLLTSLGHLDVRVPRAREGASPGADSIGRYRRRAEEIDAAICEAYVGGVSTRGVQRVTKALTGEAVTRSTVSRITKRLEEQVEELRKSSIGETPYLYLDATFLDARWARRVENVSALVAYGIGRDGKRELLAVTIGARESEASWVELLEQLIRRGLSAVRLVVSDDHSGLRAAVRHLLPEALHQRCTVHLMRNVLTKVPHRLRPRIAREVTSILHAPSAKEAKKRRQLFDKQLGAQIPEAMTCLRDGFSDATVYFQFPKEHWKRIRSTNGLERLHREIKRRIRSVGAFPDRSSALRLVTAVALQATTIWRDRRYLDLTKLTNSEEEHQAA